MGAGNKSAKKAAEAQIEGAERARQEYERNTQQGMDYAKGQYGQGRQDITDYFGKTEGYANPYLEGGKSALADYLAGLGLGGADAQKGVYDRFTQTPGYQAALNEGQRALERSNAASGMARSGAAQKALLRYGQDYADQRYGQYMDRLGNMAGMGANMAQYMGNQAMGAGGSLASNSTELGRLIAQMYGNMGENAANSELAKANAIAQREMSKKSPWSGVGSLLGAGAGFFLGGGPTGAAAGAKAGGAVGSAF